MQSMLLSAIARMTSRQSLVMISFRTGGSLFDLLFYWSALDFFPAHDFELNYFVDPSARNMLPDVAHAIVVGTVFLAFGINSPNITKFRGKLFC